MLYENKTFPDRELCALVVSKVVSHVHVCVYHVTYRVYVATMQVYYHLGSFQDSLVFALSAGRRFDVTGSTEYSETILCMFSPSSSPRPPPLIHTLTTHTLHLVYVQVG